MTFTVGQRVKRNPKVWKNDATIFTVVAVKGKHFMVQRPGKIKDVWTGKMRAPDPMPYLQSELVAA